MPINRGHSLAALEKLEHALGHQRFSVHLDDPALLGDVRRVVDQGLRAEISYHSASSDRTGSRVIDPARLSAIEGRWYLDAVDLGVGSFRRFRVDRIDVVRPTGEKVDGTNRWAASKRKGTPPAPPARGSTRVPPSSRGPTPRGCVCDSKRRPRGCSTRFRSRRRATFPRTPTT